MPDNIIITHGVRTNLTKLAELVKCGKVKDFDWLKEHGFHWKTISENWEIQSTANN